MTAAATAERYLKEHGGGIAALKAILADLGSAYNAGRLHECDMLIDAMNELRVRCAMAEPGARTNYAQYPLPAFRAASQGG